MELLTSRTIILASASPRRLDLLRQAGVEPRIFPVQVEEAGQLGGAGLDSPEQLVMANARLKARAALSRLAGTDALILGADTLVYGRDRLLGKPWDPQEAREMLALLSGAQHSVFTGQCLIDAVSGAETAACSQTRVSFASLSRAEIAAYVASGEPLDKAGAYGMQGLGGLFVDSISGDYSTVVGLSLPLLYKMVKRLAG